MTAALRAKCDRFSRQAGNLNHYAIKSLARSAALEERLSKLEGEPNSSVAVVLWTYVRALCHETGVDHNLAVSEAREWATRQ